MARKRIASRLHLLTVREVQTAGDGDHSDGGGLILRVRDKSAAWVFRYTAASGKRREMGLGVARRNNPTVTGESITGARDAAARCRMQLQQGVDPIDERAKQKGDAKKAAADEKAKKADEATTLARAARAYHERVIEPSRTDKHASQWINSLEQHVPAELWHAPISTIQAPALLDAVADICRKTPETGMRVRQRLDAIFEDAIFRGLCASNPAAALKRKLRETQSRRDRGQFKALPFVDAPAFVRELGAAEGIAARCLEFALLTAARTGEAINAEWREFDLERALWTVPAEKMKAGELHVVYLSDRALDLVRGQAGLDARWVFPSPMLDAKPLSNMAMLTLLRRMDADKRTTVHGLCRATFSTWANETAAARPDVIEACLAHEESNRVRASYNRATFAGERRALLTAWATFLGHPPAAHAANVVELPRAA
jgi:integrase